MISCQLFIPLCLYACMLPRLKYFPGSSQKILRKNRKIKCLRQRSAKEILATKWLPVRHSLALGGWVKSPIWNQRSDNMDT